CAQSTEEYENEKEENRNMRRKVLVRGATREGNKRTERTFSVLDMVDVVVVAGVVDGVQDGVVSLIEFADAPALNAIGHDGQDGGVRHIGNIVCTEEVTCIISAGTTLYRVGGCDRVLLQVGRAQQDPDVTGGGGVPPRNRISLEEKETREGSWRLGAGVDASWNASMGERSSLEGIECLSASFTWTRMVKSPRAMFRAPMMLSGMKRAGGRRWVSCSDAALAASFWRKSFDDVVVSGVVDDVPTEGAVMLGCRHGVTAGKERCESEPVRGRGSHGEHGRMGEGRGGAGGEVEAGGGGDKGMVCQDGGPRQELQIQMLSADLAKALVMGSCH
ncbi:hypothetical protein CYMTET_14429, partial [Cymbomonas tetramitiformis]